MNIKKVILVFSVIIAISLIMGGILVKGSFFSGLLNKTSGSLELKDEKVLDSNNVSYIYVKDLHTNINIFPTDESNIKVKFYENSGIQKDKGFILSTKINKDKVTIELASNKKLFFSWKGNEKLDVYIPKEYSGDINIQTSEGTANISDLDIKNLEINATSGHIITKNFTSTNAIVKNSSGKIKMTEFAGELKAENSSGGIEIAYKQFNKNNIQLISNSGSVQLDLPDNSTFYLNAKALSGKVSCKLPIQIKKVNRNLIEGSVGDTTNKIKIETGSGSINIK